MKEEGIKPDQRRPYIVTVCRPGSGAHGKGGSAFLATKQTQKGSASMCPLCVIASWTPKSVPGKSQRMPSSSTIKACSDMPTHEKEALIQRPPNGIDAYQQDMQQQCRLKCNLRLL